MRSLVAALLALLVLSGCGASSRNQIRYVDMDSGSHSGKSDAFNPTGSWDVTYSWDCKRQRSEGLKDLDRLDLTIYNSDDNSTAFETPEVHRRGAQGGATVHYARAGWYYITVDSPCDWKLLVVDTSRT